MRLWPFWHRFAPFWQANGASPNLLQSCRFPELQLLLHDDSMLRCWTRGRRSGRCVPWVTLLGPDKGPNAGNAISLQHMHAFKPDQGVASRAQIHAGYAGKFYTSAVILSSEFGAGSGKQRALFQHHIPFFRNCLQLTVPISTPRPSPEPEKYKQSNGVLRSGNGAVDAKLCLERPIWPHLP